MAKDDEVKNGNYTFEVMFTKSTPNTVNRTVKCHSCFNCWETVKHPNSITECPICHVENNSTRRVISYWDKENEKIILD